MCSKKLHDLSIIFDGLLLQQLRDNDLKRVSEKHDLHQRIKSCHKLIKKATDNMCVYLYFNIIITII